jgi:hypothetical protein
MAGLFHSQGKLDDGLALCHTALDGRRQLLGSQHPSTLLSIRATAALLVAKGELEEAEPLYREAVVLSRSLNGHMHPYTRAVIVAFVELLDARGCTGEAAEFRALLRPSHPVDSPAHPHPLVQRPPLGRLCSLCRADPLHASYSCNLAGCGLYSECTECHSLAHGAASASTAAV